MRSRGLMLGLLLALVSVAPGGAQGGGGGGGGNRAPSGSFQPGRLGLIEGAFVLSKEQTKQVKAILDDAGKSAVTARDQLAKTRVAIADAIHARKPQAEIDAAVNAYGAQSAAMTAIEMKAMARVMQSLEKEQRANAGAVTSLFYWMRGAFLEKNWDDVPGTKLY